MYGTYNSEQEKLRATVNTYLNSCPGSAFGGYKNSGYGRELHAMALDAYSNVKNINVDFAEGGPIFF